MNRRDYLGALGVVAGGAALLSGSGCATVGQRFVKARKQSSPPPPSTKKEKRESNASLRLLNRAGFGPAPEDIAHLEEMGRSAWVEEQLDAPVAVGVPSLVGLGWHQVFRNGGDDPGGESSGLLYRLAGIEALHFSTYEERDWPEAKVREALTQAALLRAVYSKWQLRERMVAFWSDHFNIYGPKVINFGAAYATTHLTYYLEADQMSVIRQHALGRFPDLLQASARSPAMLGYLDNQISKKGVANENYAREIMELHSLGVGGGYTQKDVQEVARCLTGWTVEHRFRFKRGTFSFDPDQHDTGEKIVLGQKIPARSGKDGEQDGVDVVRILARHPSTARFISRKLVRHFWGEEDEEWVTRLAAIYQKTDGDIAAMLRPMLLVEELTTAPPILKRPWDFLASSLRATNADTNAGTEVQKHLATMGQPLFEWPMPNGYPEKTTAWTGSLLARWNFAFALANGGIKGTSLPDDWAKAKETDALVASVLGGELDEAMVSALKAAKNGAEAMALAVASPAFQWR